LALPRSLNPFAASISTLTASDGACMASRALSRPLLKFQEHRHHSGYSTNGLCNNLKVRMALSRPLQALTGSWHVQAFSWPVHALSMSTAFTGTFLCSKSPLMASTVPCHPHGLYTGTVKT
jgi:hypothetical protein